ncbi:MAG: metallophosphoesterase family protein [Solirubrobacterales bacterium]
MRILAFSDLHRDLDQAGTLTRMAAEADVVVGAGDFASVHQGLEETLTALSGIKAPTVLVPGNNETFEALREAVERLWPVASVLHGSEVEIDGQIFYGLGAGIPTTPWEWSFDLDETEAEGALAATPADAVLVVHSPPKNHCDANADGLSLGSAAILSAIQRTTPKLVVCGHIHEAWGQTSKVGETEIINLGPSGRFIEI